MKYLIILVALIITPAFAGSASDQLFNTGMLKIESLQEELSGGKLDDLSYAKRLEAITREYMPDDYVANSFARDLLSLTRARDRGDIDQLKYEMMVSERLRQTQESLANRTEKYEKEIARQKQAIHEVEARQAYADNPPINPFAAMMMMNMINNSGNRIGKSMQPNNLQFPTHCHSSAYGNGIDTTCY